MPSVCCWNRENEQRQTLACSHSHTLTLTLSYLVHLRSPHILLTILHLLLAFEIPLCSISHLSMNCPTRLCSSAFHVLSLSHAVSCLSIICSLISHLLLLFTSYLPDLFTSISYAPRSPYMLTPDLHKPLSSLSLSHCSLSCFFTSFTQQHSICSSSY